MSFQFFSNVEDGILENKLFIKRLVTLFKQNVVTVLK